MRLLAAAAAAALVRFDSTASLEAEVSADAVLHSAAQGCAEHVASFEAGPYRSLFAKYADGLGTNPDRFISKVSRGLQERCQDELAYRSRATKDCLRWRIARLDADPFFQHLAKRAARGLSQHRTLEQLCSDEATAHPVTAADRNDAPARQEYAVAATWPHWNAEPDPNALSVRCGDVVEVLDLPVRSAGDAEAPRVFVMRDPRPSEGLDFAHPIPADEDLQGFVPRTHLLELQAVAPVHAACPPLWAYKARLVAMCNLV